jgi:hypothetical protein
MTTARSAAKLRLLVLGFLFEAAATAAAERALGAADAVARVLTVAALARAARLGFGGILSLVRCRTRARGRRGAQEGKSCLVSPPLPPSSSSSFLLLLAFVHA